jgi:conjugative relaxase-like TrwC/TraI family protein
MRMMGADSVAYHRETIIERGDDFPGAGLDYYASRGETPLLWGGMGAESLGLVGPVDSPSYDAIYGPGGACDPKTGERLVNAKRPGMELVIAAHKSVAELGVLGRMDDMHAIMDAERDATLEYLDQLTQERGGRRGVAAIPTATTGLVYAHARHATTRAGDPGPHDHVLLANLIEMRDEKGGTKAPDTTLWREHLHAATMVGRVASARKAVELGYGIEADRGPSGKLGHWKIQGIPDKALAVHSKRSEEINQAVAEKGFDSYQARSVAARDTRSTKRHTGVDELLPVWRKELSDAGFPTEQLVADIDQAGIKYAREHTGQRFSDQGLRQMAERVLGPDGTLSQRKVFAKRDVIVAVAPRVFGLPAVELEKATDRVLRDPDAIPLLGVPRASERAYATASVIATERFIEQAVERGVENLHAARVRSEVAEAALGRQLAVLGSPLTPGQQAAVFGIATSGRRVELVEGVAGSGKTTVMAAVRDAFESDGFTVVGTSTSGQAARTLGEEAGLSESRTLASLRWRLEHHKMRLTPNHVLVLDEAGMASDRDIAFLLDQARWAKTKVVMVGDDRQLGAIPVGGALGALVERHGGVVHVLDQNVRQHDEAERAALAELRAGDVNRAVEFYVDQHRLTTERTRDEALAKLVDRWAGDALRDADAAMFAWRRANVAELNRLAREQMMAHGRVHGPELVTNQGARYAAGDRIIALAPLAEGQIVTSERGVVTEVDLEEQRLIVEMENGRRFQLEQEAIATQLAHGYATTVHRSQGATHDIAHVFEDGGGRELAYVAMSRAREWTELYLVADDLDQAREDLARSWQRERRERWAIDTGVPQPDVATRKPPEPAALRKLALQAERDALRVAIPNSLEPHLKMAESELRRANWDLENLRRDRGWRSEGELGDAAGELRWARQYAWDNERTAENKALGWRMRRDARHQAVEWAERVTSAEARLEKLLAVEEAKLIGALNRAKEKVSDINQEIGRREQWLDDHPRATAQLQYLNGQVNGLDNENNHERWTVEGELNPRPAPTPRIEHSRSRDDDYHSIGRDNDRDYGFGL